MISFVTSIVPVLTLRLYFRKYIWKQPINDIDYGNTTVTIQTTESATYILLIKHGIRLTFDSENDTKIKEVSQASYVFKHVDRLSQTQWKLKIPNLDKLVYGHVS